MGRFKSIEIEGLFFENFNEIFEEAFIKAIRTSSLTEAQIAEKLAPKFETLISEYEESISSFYLEKHKFDLDTFLKIHFKNQGKIAERNKDSFIPFILYVNACVIVYEKIIQQVKDKRIDSTLKMNIALYGLVVRRAQQIVDLLLSGYIDAAMIIWRSLYENAIILLVIAIENNNQLADKFFEHSTRNAQRKVTSYNKNFKELKFKPLPKSTDKILKTETEKLKQKYGKDFLNNEFGWADDLFQGNQKANFKLLEEKVEMIDLDLIICYAVNKFIRILTGLKDLWMEMF